MAKYKMPKHGKKPNNIRLWIQAEKIASQINQETDFRKIMLIYQKLGGSFKACDKKEKKSGPLDSIKLDTKY